MEQILREHAHRPERESLLASSLVVFQLAKDCGRRGLDVEKAELRVDQERTGIGLLLSAMTAVLGLRSAHAASSMRESGTELVETVRSPAVSGRYSIVFTYPIIVASFVILFVVQIPNSRDGPT